MNGQQARTFARGVKGERIAGSKTHLRHVVRAFRRAHHAAPGRKLALEMMSEDCFYAQG